MAEAAINNVLVAGSGVMGRGIAAAFARGGFSVAVLSRDPAKVGGLPGQVAVITDPDAFEPDLVVESVPERMDPKHALYERIEAAYGGRPILATNTSGLPLAALSERLRYPKRFAGLHYCQPADVVPLVEVAPGPETAPTVMASLDAAVRACRQIPLVLGKAPPGLLINRLQHALMHEAYYLIEQGIASAADVDLVARMFLGPRFCVTGMIEQKDLSGIDTHAYAQAAIVPALHHGAEPSRLVQEMARGNRIGVKSGTGFYDWSGRDTDAYRNEAKTKLDRLLGFLEDDLGSLDHPPMARPDT